MAETKGRLYKDTHKQGYNTRDNPQDVPFESGLMLVNATPGDPSCFPRDGIAAWNTTALPAAPSHIFPWADATDPRLILVIGQDLVWKRTGSGAATTIAAGVVPVGSNLSYCRIKNLMFINSDLTGSSHRSWILSWDGSTFLIRNSSITRPTLVLSGSVQAGGAVAYSKWRGYAFTLVNRNDAASVDGSNQPKLCRLQDGNFHPGLLESTDDIDNRLELQQTDGSSVKALRVVANRNGATIDTQVTHLRIYATESTDSQLEAQGLSKRWIADMPIVGANAYSQPWTYDDTTTDGELAGALDIMKVVGYEGMPPGTYMLYFAGLLWVGGVGGNEAIGRNFFSQIPLDVEFPQKWWSMFATDTQFKDISYEDGEPSMGIGVSHGDVIFLGKRSVWYLREGDTGYEPKFITNKGTEFPNSITSINEDLAYLSKDGPALVVARSVEILQAHTAGEVWPKIADNTKGYFFGLADKTTVRGFYFRENWWLTDGVKLIGYFSPAKATAVGPWSVEVGDSAIGYNLVAVLDPDEICVLVASAGATPKLWGFLDATVHQDNGSDFWLKGSGKAYYVNRRDRDKCGELYTLKMFAHYEDAAVMFITIKSDFFRFILEMEYNEWDTESQLVSEDANISFRNIMEQPIPEGLFGAFFQVEWRKLHSTPYSFTHKGWVMEYLPRDGHPSEFVSKSQGDGLVAPHPDSILYLRFDEDSDIASDSSIYARHHAYSEGAGGARTTDPSLVPAGGQSLIGGDGSGYTNENWDGMDHIGDDAGLNSDDLTYEYVVAFPTLAAVVVIHEAGNGESYWRLQVNTDGSLEFQILTTVLSYKFKSADGVISAGSFQYTIQFVLSNGGMNGQFYAAVRTASFATLTTTRSAL